MTVSHVYVLEWKEKMKFKISVLLICIKLLIGKTRRFKGEKINIVVN